MKNKTIKVHNENLKRYLHDKDINVVSMEEKWEFTFVTYNLDVE